MNLVLVWFTQKQILRQKNWRAMVYMGNNLTNNNREGKEATKGNIIKQVSLWAEFVGEYLDVCVSYFLLRGKGPGVFIHQPLPVIGWDLQWQNINSLELQSALCSGRIGSGSQREAKNHTCQQLEVGLAMHGKGVCQIDMGRALIRSLFQPLHHLYPLLPHIKFTPSITDSSRWCLVPISKRRGLTKIWLVRQATEPTTQLILGL